jgi:hypothetical protein
LCQGLASSFRQTTETLPVEIVDDSGQNGRLTDYTITHLPTAEDHPEQPRYHYRHENVRDAPRFSLLDQAARNEQLHKDGAIRARINMDMGLLYKLQKRPALARQFLEQARPPAELQGNAFMRSTRRLRRYRHEET